MTNWKSTVQQYPSVKFN